MWANWTKENLKFHQIENRKPLEQLSCDFSLFLKVEREVWAKFFSFAVGSIGNCFDFAGLGIDPSRKEWKDRLRNRF